MKKYISLLTLIPVLICIILYSSRNVDNAKQSTIAGNKFYEVLFSKKDSELLEGIDSSWKHLADFESAFSRISNSTSIDAASIYSDIADNEDVPDVLRELAQYLEVMNLLYSSYKINEDKINNLAANAVYPYSSQEAIAIIKIHNNDIKGAIEILRLLSSDRKCPTIIRANAQELLRIYEN
ncbi:MAG: hypothetical protein ACR5K2_01235 [Wolbachia sp.]